MRRLVRFSLFVLMSGVLLLNAASFAAAPPTLTRSVSDGVETMTLQMTLESVRGSNFEVLVQNGTGAYDSHTAADVVTYIGSVMNIPVRSRRGY